MIGLVKDEPPPRGVLFVGGTWHGHLRVICDPDIHPGASVHLHPLKGPQVSQPASYERYAGQLSSAEEYRYHIHEMPSGARVEAFYATADGAASSATLLDALALSWRRVRIARGDTVWHGEGTR